MCDMTHSHVWHDSSTCVTWLIRVCMYCLLMQVRNRRAGVNEQRHVDGANNAQTHSSRTRSTLLAGSYYLCRSVIDMCDMTHSCAWLDALVCVTWLIHMCDMTHSYVWLDSSQSNSLHSPCLLLLLMQVSVLHMINVTHSYVWHDSFVCVTWLFHKCDMTHSYVCHDSFICVTWLIHVHETHLQVWHNSFICVT